MSIAARRPRAKARSPLACSRLPWASARIRRPGPPSRLSPGVVRHFDKPTDGTHYLRIEQGVDMGRPSMIDLEIDIHAGNLKAVRIGGQAVVIASGELLI